MQNGQELWPSFWRSRRRGTGPIPTSPIRARRGRRSQVEIAQMAGISQGFVSDLESGKKRLTPEVAQRLAPALGTTADQLMLSEHLAKLNRVAQKGRIDPQPLLAEAERLAEVVPSGEIGDAIVDALVGIVRGGFKIETLRRVRKSNVNEIIEQKLLASKNED